MEFLSHTSKCLIRQGDYQIVASLVFKKQVSLQQITDKHCKGTVESLLCGQHCLGYINMFTERSQRSFFKLVWIIFSLWTYMWTKYLKQSLTDQLHFWWNFHWIQGVIVSRPCGIWGWWGTSKYIKMNKTGHFNGSIGIAYLCCFPSQL